MRPLSLMSSSILRLSQQRQFAVTTTGMIGDVCVPIFKMLCPSSDTGSAYTGVFICMLKLYMNSWCGVFLLSKKFYHCTLLKQHVLAGHFLALKYDQIMGQHDMIFILMWDYRCNWSHITHCNMSWHLFVIPWCSVIVWPSYNSARVTPFVWVTP
jgi:hypothetical protein